MPAVAVEPAEKRCGRAWLQADAFGDLPVVIKDNQGDPTVDCKVGLALAHVPVRAAVRVTLDGYYHLMDRV